MGSRVTDWRKANPKGMSYTTHYEQLSTYISSEHRAAPKNSRSLLTPNPITNHVGLEMFLG